MKKTFRVKHDKIKPPRMFEAFKHEVSRYLKRERGKALPKGAEFWGFDCRIGADEANSQQVHVYDINKAISQLEADHQESFYLEILARPATRKPKKDDGVAEE